MNNNENRKKILSIEKLRKYFVNHGFINKAVDGVSFDVHEGEIVGLIGESGSGKTTVGRSILRLYDDSNGFVRLEDQIISGKTISAKKRKFLRKNMQMIFQDPHASLNGQQNIYAILKEPLLVNGVMKEKLDDIFVDWFDIKEANKFTFQLRAMQLELDNLNEVIRLADPFFTSWSKNFETLKVEENLSNEDNFTAFYGYLEEKQSIESLIINNMYSNAAKLLEFYYEQQKKFRNNQLSEPELIYEEAKRNYKKAIELSKHTTAGLGFKAEAAKFKVKYQELKEIISNLKVETANTFSNYSFEAKNEKILTNISRLMSTNLEFYAYTLKKEKLIAKQKKIIAQIKKECQYIGFEKAKELIEKLNDYSLEFFKNKLEAIPYSEFIAKEIKTILDAEFNFEFKEYVEFARKHSRELHAELAHLKRYKNLYSALKNDLTLIAEKKFKPSIDKEKLEEAKLEFEKASEIYEKGKLEFLAKIKGQLQSLYFAIEAKKKRYAELVELQTKCNEQFKAHQEVFFKYLNEKSENFKKEVNEIKGELRTLKANRDEADNANAKKIKQLEKALARKTSLMHHTKTSIKTFTSDIAIKEDTLKSFTIEKKYLTKDIKRIYILLGVNKKWVESNVTGNDGEKADASFKHQKWSRLQSIYNTKLGKLIARVQIAELLYKTTIYKALEDVGLLKQFAYRYPHEFSGGQLQRIVIARALITEPKIIVADEPIASLDISIQAQVVNLLKELCVKKNIGMIFIAHDLSMIEYVADRVQIMHLGKIVESGKTEAIYANPMHPYTINLFKAIPKISNSNEKFQNISFELNYLEEQRFPNVPENIKVGEDHYVYGTKAQVETWIKENKQN